METKLCVVEALYDEIRSDCNQTILYYRGRQVLVIPECNVSGITIKMHKE